MKERHLNVIKARLESLEFGKKSSITSIDTTHMDKLALKFDNGDVITMKFLNDQQKAVTWSTYDFEQQANERWVYWANHSKVKTWHHAQKVEDVYDELKYQEALERMMSKHDANIGITWDTIDFYLDDMCMKTQEKHVEQE